MPYSETSTSVAAAAAALAASASQAAAEVDSALNAMTMAIATPGIPLYFSAGEVAAVAPAGPVTDSG